MKVFVFDIDGTLADNRHRLHYIQKEPQDWVAFMAAVVDDKPIDHVWQVLKSLSFDRPIVFVTTRYEQCREATEKWLLAHAEQYGAVDLDYVLPVSLYMRKQGDDRDDAVIKMELLADMRRDGYEPVMVFDDRTSVVKAWRAAGVPCAQVADGDF